MVRRNRAPADVRRVERILKAARGSSGVSERAEAISGALVGTPYAVNPLGGSADEKELFRAPLDGFDCVTYVETVLAAALARDARGFARTLRRLRYAEGRVAWEARNHYMTGWVAVNRRAGLVRPVGLGPGTVAKRRVLDAVPGLPPRAATVRALPKRLVRGAAKKLRTGDVVCFASTRPRLDVFHCGLVVKQGERLLLRHASRSRGAVVEQDLFEFLRANRTAGILVARPVGATRRKSAKATKAKRG